MVAGRSLILSGMPARCLIAWMTTLEAACIRGELLPVMIRPSGSSSAAPQNPLAAAFEFHRFLCGAAGGKHDPSVFRL